MKISYMSGGIGNEAYDASVIVRALDRAGRCSQLKGHIHEIMYSDLYNLANVLNGNRARLTRSVIAPVKDVIATGRNGRVVMHGQFKDTISNSGAHKTARQIMSGKYRKTTVYGTEETAREVNRILDKVGKAKQRVKSSGISSKTTSRIANKALGKTPTWAAVGSAAKAGGLAGAAISGGIEAVSSIYDVINGEKEWGDAFIDIGGAAAKGGITGAGSSVAGCLGSWATKKALGSFASTSIGSVFGSTAMGAFAIGAAPWAIGFGVACAVGGIISWFLDD